MYLIHVYLQYQSKKMHRSSNTTTKHHTSVIVITQFAQSVCPVLCLISVYILCTTNKYHGSKCVDTIYVFTDVYIHCTYLQMYM